MILSPEVPDDSKENDPQNMKELPRYCGAVSAVSSKTGGGTAADWVGDPSQSPRYAATIKGESINVNVNRNERILRPKASLIFPGDVDDYCSGTGRSGAHSTPSSLHFFATPSASLAYGPLAFLNGVIFTDGLSIRPERCPRSGGSVGPKYPSHQNDQDSERYEKQIHFRLKEDDTAISSQRRAKIVEQ